MKEKRRQVPVVNAMCMFLVPHSGTRNMHIALVKKGLSLTGYFGILQKEGLFCL